MPRFRKPIVKAGVYNVATPSGERRTEIITDERIRHWASIHTQMNASGTGFKIPAPWAHSFKGKDGNVFIPGPISMSSPENSGRSDYNAGFWEKLEAMIDPADGLMTLFGEVEVPGDANDAKTPAGKIGKSVRETSIFAAPEFQDGKGNKFNDVLMHVALVTHPIEPGQKNFEEVKEYGLAMSHYAFKLGGAMKMSAIDPPTDQDESTDPFAEDTEDEENDDSEINIATDEDVGTVLPLLRKCGINLPDDVNAANFVSYLKVALGQKSFEGDDDDGEGYGENGKGKKKKGSINQPPEGAEEESAATFMSTNITEATLMSHPVVTGLQAQNQGLLNLLTATAKKNRVDRVNVLVGKGHITQDYANSKLLPQIEAFQMSFAADGNLVPQAVDSVIEALEATAPTQPTKQVQGMAFNNPAMAQMANFMMSATAPEGSDTPVNHQAGFIPLTPDQTKALADNLASMI